MSLHWVEFGAQRLVACSDLIGCIEGQPSRADMEKLFQIGEWTLCGICGALQGARPDDLIADRIYRLSSVGELRDSPKRFLSALRDDLAPIFAQRFAEHNSQYRGLLPDHETLFVAFSIKRERSGAIDLLELQFPIHEANGKAALGDTKIIPHLEHYVPKGPMAYALCDDPALENHALIDPDIGDGVLLAGIDKAIDDIRGASERTRAEVTPNTDVAVIEAKGVRWLRKLVSGPSQWKRLRSALGPLYAMQSLCRA